MSIVAFNFNSIHAERKSTKGSGVSIKNQTSITEVAEKPLGNQKALLFSFKNSIDYEPGVGSIQLLGDVLVMSNEKEAKETVEAYKKTKRFSPELTQKVYNAILSRASVQALIVAKDLNLPPPFKLPHLEAQSTPAKESKKK